MEKIIISATVLLLTIGTFANPVRYSYDAAGNRVRREIVVNSSPSFSPKKQTTYYTDVLSKDSKVKLHQTGNGQICVEVVAVGDIPEGTVEVYTTSGVRVLASNIEHGQALVNLGSRQNGVYVLNIKFGEEQTSWKITKK